MQQIKQMTWLVIHTKPSQEARADLNLKNQGFTTYLPMHKKEMIRGRTIKNILSPLFPRYLFVEYSKNSNTSDVGLIRSTFGVHQMLKIHEKPLEVKDDVIVNIRARENLEKSNLESFYQRGDKVKIKTGAFKNIEAIFQCEDKEKRAVLLFELINKPTKIYIHKKEIKKI